MRLAVLDQVPVTDHTPTPAGALASSLRLAQEVDTLGYHRIWFAEHHHSASFASSAPEMMAALALERTATIRVGTGGILLPLYQATKVIEVMGLLGMVHGDRVDTGVGRAALDDPAYAEKIHALVGALGAEHPAVPGEPDGRVWVLGAGGSAAPLAGDLGAGYVHGHFFVPRGGEEATAAYREASTTTGHRPHTVLAVRAITAASTEAGRGDAVVARPQGPRVRRADSVGRCHRGPPVDRRRTHPGEGPVHGDHHRASGRGGSATSRPRQGSRR